MANSILLLLFISGIASMDVRAAPTLSDPTRPSFTPAIIIEKNTSMEQKQQLLTAIFIKKGLKQAIINNKLYKTGDYFDNKKIIAIRTNQVVLQNSKGVTRLSLINPFKKIKKH